MRWNKSGRFVTLLLIPLAFFSGPHPALVQSETEPVYVLETIAGDIGDGGPARRAKLVCPLSVAVDRAGNVYFADGQDNRVRKINRDGIITTVAGTGLFTSDGDGGPAGQASLYHPTAVALDPEGNLLIGEFSGRHIRRVDADTGIITTIAGNGELGYGGDGGPALEAEFREIKDVAVDRDGTIYVIDERRVRRITPDGIITTLTGSPFSNEFNGDEIPAQQATLSPASVAVDGRGSIYIADFGNDRIRKITPDGIIHTVAGNGDRRFAGDGGPATEARLALPRGVTVDADGNIYITELGNARVRRVDPSGIITTLAGDGSRQFRETDQALTTGFYSPEDIAVDHLGNLYFPDIEFYATFERYCERVYTNTGIRKITPDGRAIWLAGSGFDLGDGRSALFAALTYPLGLATDGEGNIYIADNGHARIRRIDHVTGIITTVAGNSDPDLRGREDPGPIPEGALATEVELRSVEDVAVGQNGNLYIANADDSVIYKVTPAGRIFSVAGRGRPDSGIGDSGPATGARLSEPQGITVGPDGNLYIADTFHRRIRKVDLKTGIITTVAGNGMFGETGDGGPATEAGIYEPVAVAVAKDGTLYLATPPTIRKVTPQGVISKITEGLDSMKDIAVDATGNVYVTQWIESHVWRIDPSGIVANVVGNEIAGFPPSGWLATEASIALPTGLALLPDGTLIFADAYNQSIHRLRPVQK